MSGGGRLQRDVDGGGRRAVGVRWRKLFASRFALVSPVLIPEDAAAGDCRRVGWLQTRIKAANQILTCKLASSGSKSRGRRPPHLLLREAENRGELRAFLQAAECRDRRRRAARASGDT